MEGIMKLGVIINLTENIEEEFQPSFKPGYRQLS